MMSKVSLRERWPFLLSLLIHVALLALLLLSFTPSQYRLPGPVDPKAIIHVKTVSATALAKQQRLRDRQLAQQRLAKQRRLAEQKRAQAKRRRATRLAKQRRLAAARKAAAVKKAKALAQAKQRRQRALQQAQQKKKRLQQAKLQAQHQQLVKKMMAEQLARESTQLQQQRARQQKGIIDAYRPRIIAAIGQKWLLPPGVQRRLRCLYQINLAPGGVVIGVRLLSSSGNAALDRSASQAIWNASPLPVPKNPALFDKFRVLNLTVRPENAMMSG